MRDLATKILLFSTIKLDIMVPYSFGADGPDGDWLSDEIDTLREMLTEAARNRLAEHCAAEKNGITVESHY